MANVKKLFSIFYALSLSQQACNLSQKFRQYAAAEITTVKSFIKRILVV
jgi:hypothetical protein